MSVSRRNFIKGSALLGGSLVVGVSLTGCGPTPLPHAAAGDLQPNAFIQLTPQGDFIMQLHKVEMGQGTHTGLATLVAEELNMPPEMLRIEHAQFHPDFIDPDFYVMLTGGSSSVRTSFTPLREAAAMLSQLLRQAAAEQQGIGIEQVQLRDGSLYVGDKQIAPGSLVEMARQLPQPETLELKPATEFRFIGKQNTRLDAHSKSTGTATFGIDAQYPGALSAVLLRCPHFGGSLKGFDASAAEGSPGLVQVLEVDGAVAVLADNYWHARQAANKIQLDWDKGPLAGVSSDALRAQRHELAKTEEGKVVEELGEASAATGERFEVMYDVPYLAHATMEPMNALAVPTENGLEIWSGMQGVQLAVDAVARATGLEKSQIQVHNHFLGGGFGRRIQNDYVVEAARIAQLSGKPVRLIWSREDDTRHDYYRPNSSALMAATVDGDTVSSLQIKAVAPSIFGQFLPLMTRSLLPAWLPGGVHETIGDMAAGSDPAATEGLIHSPYQFPYKRSNYVMQELTAPLGYWRSVGHSQNAFFIEGFIDELAHRTGRNPLDFRLANMDKASRHYRVLSEVAKRADWGNPPAGQFQGLAVHESFGSVVAEVVTVSVDGGQLKVHKVVCAVDCGMVVNPEIVVAQMESGIIFGLTAALKGEITLQDGAVQQSNFHDYGMLRMPETPEIEVHLLASTNPPSGVGEPGTPPIAPALANAIFAATGQRLRQLPLRLS
ncbi:MULTISPECIES: xanthine dehydrogenase family protein molybdopterin-binding subunit [Spongiibacter]|uniref:xanthine dehydrogenase family protein molybdopterin-binding subunit n=1 Tax=Spongiibacter TaxID=630749 RepID=UPI000C40FB3E|nr:MULTISPECIES: xanthine dehydrogenase family protein molybdopterin-binding subunit [Spongiibacter]MAY39352.1 isoquinoline 1-oxidoreductase [Spongiibacter sp.]MBI58938.1 isoquinoline 1-oxidoreductase [Spongiibacter sp.]|tara:strand:+ start:1730 stop:3892 length:2163 start_codon:yes stop_codon:yes gene_type:complete